MLTEKVKQTQSKESFNEFVLGSLDENFAEASNRFLVANLLQLRKHAALSTRICHMRHKMAQEQKRKDMCRRKFHHMKSKEFQT